MKLRAIANETFSLQHPMIHIRPKTFCEEFLAHPRDNLECYCLFHIDVQDMVRGGGIRAPMYWYK
jgi:hypothetical protein